MPKTMITIEKKELEEHFNEIMLGLVNDVLTEYFEEDFKDDTVDSFEEYDKVYFNEAFTGTRKKIRNIYIGRAIEIKSMIEFFGVYVDKRGHQMLMTLIESDIN